MAVLQSSQIEILTGNNILPELIKKIIYSKPEGLSGKIIAVPLNIASRAYGPLVEFKYYLHKKGILERKRLPIKVISIGNITLGGTGKTPTTQYLAKFLSEKGFKPIILSRGYKRKGNIDEIKIVSDGNKILSNPSESGDEPYLLAQNLKGVPVVVGKNRYKAGMLAIEKFKSNVALLDDGFQHFALDRDLDILLINSLNPFGNGYLFPRGQLREPIKALSRAGIIIITKSDSEMRNNRVTSVPHFPIKSIDEITNTIRKYNTKALIAKSIHKFTKLFGENDTLELNQLKDKKVLAFCGIADEYYFTYKLSQIASNNKCIIFDDHHHYTESDVNNILNNFQEFKADILVTTQKDYYKVKKLFIDNRRINATATNPYYIGMEIEIIENKEALENLVLQILNIS